MQKVGLIGCGNISNTYLGNNTIFPNVRIVKCADMRDDAAKAAAEKFNLEAVSVESLLKDPEIDIILNLTTPESHAGIDLKALEAGKHVFSEKPFAVVREDGQKILKLAESKGLRVGCAPDTFLGGGHQTCRKLLDNGMAGQIIGGTSILVCPGHESWHPAPGFYYKKGGGPLMDMGPYHITALINLFGPVKRVAAFGSRSTDLRQGCGVNQGKTFPVEVDTHISAILEFASGVVINMIMSFDVCFGIAGIELWSHSGAMRTPDPNTFSGEILVTKAGSTSGWESADNTFIYNENTRIIGLADMAAGIEKQRPHRCNGKLAYHVLDVMCSILDACEKKEYITLQSTCERPAPLPEGLRKGEID